MKVAVIGGGISGLGSALILSQSHEVHLFESDNRLGGHANTVQVNEDGHKVPIDTGFLVYNELTYPHLTSFFKYLEVNTADSDMSLSVRIENKNLEWCGTNLNTVFAQRKNLLKPSFYKMLFNILRFNREAEQNLLLATSGRWTLGDLLRERGFSEDFCADYLLPMGAAIWSTPERGMLDFPASTFLNFCINHRLLQVNDRPVWKTVRGGSIEYVKKAMRKIHRVHLGVAIQSVERRAGGVMVKTVGAEEMFDKVIMATHAPVTKRLLKIQNENEDRVLGAFRDEANKAVLHSDKRLMPKRKPIWSSWNVFASNQDQNSKVFLSYYINKLQPIDTFKDYFVSLNPDRNIEAPLAELNYDHPQFDYKAIQAQSELHSIQGNGGVYYAGAWTRFGFHEDGLLSAVNVARMLGQSAPWKIA